MKPRPLIIGHRGASSYAPENTLAALHLALECGSDGVEFDVRLSKDGTPIVFHDKFLNRIGSRPDEISTLTAAELCSIDAGSWFNRTFPSRSRSSYPQQTIPTLRSVLENIENVAGPIYVELKTDSRDSARLVEQVCGLVKEHKLLPKMILKSFDRTAVSAIKRLLPEVQTGLLFQPSYDTFFRSRRQMVDLVIEAGAGHLSVHWSLITKRLLRAAADASIQITIWTVDDIRWVKMARRLGIMALITNNPAKLLAVRKLAK